MRTICLLTLLATLTAACKHTVEHLFNVISTEGPKGTVSEIGPKTGVACRLTCAAVHCTALQNS
jgi:hypothetical protein